MIPAYSTACTDWEDRILKGSSLVPFSPLYLESANDAVGVFNELRLVDVIGAPRLGDVVRPWVTDIVTSLFGSYDPISGNRYINTIFLCVSKKNGKSSIAAGVMLTALIINPRQEAEFIIIAPTKEVADNSFKPIVAMIEADQDLTDRFHIQRITRTFTDRLNGSTLKVVAASPDTVTGKKATGVFIDELHEFGKASKASHMITEATGGLASRPEGFVIYATTQSSEPPAGVFLEKLTYARKVRDGLIQDNSFLPLIYEFPKSWLKKKKHLDLSNAYVTNPNWGTSVNERIINQKFQEAQVNGSASIQDFSAKHLNVQVGVEMANDNWIAAKHWESAEGELTLDELIEQSEVITVGIDGGGLDDLLGLYVMGRERKTGRKIGWGYAWATKGVLELRKEIAPRLLDFELAKEMSIIDKVGQDVIEIADICERIHKSKKLDKIGLDPMGVGLILDELDARKIPESSIVGVSQGWKLSGPIKTAERWLATKGSFMPASQSIMRWCVGNCKTEQRSNATIITKQKSGTAKIDPIMAMLNAVYLMSLNPKAKGGSQVFF